MENTAKRALADGRKLLGVWLQMIDPAVTEIIGVCGYDVLLIDMEHGLGSVRDATQAMRAAGASTATPVVRVPSNDPVVLKSLLDQGAPGLMVPMIDTPEQAKAVVAACRYPPKGNRGLAVGITRGARYGMDVAEDYVASVEAETLVICQIETVRAVENAAAIAAVDGVDMLFIGRNDLAADAGHILDLDHPDVEAMVDSVVSAAKAAGKTVGTVPSAGRGWEKLFDDGFDLVIPSSDIAILRAFGQDEVASFKAHLSGKPRTDGGASGGY